MLLRAQTGRQHVIKPSLRVANRALATERRDAGSAAFLRSPVGPELDVLAARQELVAAEELDR